MKEIHSPLGTVRVDPNTYLNSRLCYFCAERIPEEKRSDSLFCSSECRSKFHSHSNREAAKRVKKSEDIFMVRHVYNQTIWGGLSKKEHDRLVHTGLWTSCKARG